MSRNFDKLIATLLSCNIVKNDINDKIYCGCKEGSHSIDKSFEIPKYSEDMNSSFKILGGFLYEIGLIFIEEFSKEVPYCKIIFSEDEELYEVISYNESQPMAICLAFLQYMDVDEDIAIEIHEKQYKI